MLDHVRPNRYPWEGEARPMRADAFKDAAQAIGCEPAAIRAVWEVEAAGRNFRADGSLERRFEPHKMPGSTMTYRQSLKISTADREAMFAQAYAKQPEAALKASSWGGPQIMGFNHEAVAFPTALDMVEAFADDAGAQIHGFVNLVLNWGLDSAIRAHDWRTFENRYNGGGQGGAYARKIEAAYRAHSGKASPTVVRLGDSGEAVRRLQAALGLAVDGRFGHDTEAAVRTFQAKHELPVDGIVGRRTWAALEAARDANPAKQETPSDKVAERVFDWVGKAGAGGGAGYAAKTALDRAPDGAVDLASYGLVVFGFVVAALVVAAFAWRWWRDVRT